MVWKPPDGRLAVIFLRYRRVSDRGLEFVAMGKSMKLDQIRQVGSIRNLVSKAN